MRIRCLKSNPGGYENTDRTNSMSPLRLKIIALTSDILTCISCILLKTITYNRDILN